MAYDDGLAQRLRELLADQPALTERAMFGGLGFMLHGNMACAANSAGELMVRVNPDVGRTLVDGELITPMQMQGRTLHGWLSVAPGAIETDEQLAQVVQHGIDFVADLPPK